MPEAIAGDARNHVHRATARRGANLNLRIRPHSARVPNSSKCMPSFFVCSRKLVSNTAQAPLAKSQSALPPLPHHRLLRCGVCRLIGLTSANPLQVFGPPEGTGEDIDGCIAGQSQREVDQVRAQSIGGPPPDNARLVNPPWCGSLRLNIEIQFTPFPRRATSATRIPPAGAIRGRVLLHALFISPFSALKLICGLTFYLQTSRVRLTTPCSRRFVRNWMTKKRTALLK